VSASDRRLRLCARADDADKRNEYDLRRAFLLRTINSKEDGIVEGETFSQTAASGRRISDARQGCAGFERY
jgi:hypothetical protein